jgi:hypothetical protein
VLISCPECNTKVSDKAHVCPHCGFRIDTLTRCPDCGRLVRPGTAACLGCGYLFAQKAEEAKLPSEEVYQADGLAFVATPDGDVIVPLSLSGQEEGSSEPGPSDRTHPGRRPLKLAWMRKLIVPAVLALILLVALRPHPLTYHVAAIDPQFGISESEVESILQDAAGRWNVALKKTAIRIDTGTKGSAISFVFDYRQEYQNSVAAIDSRYSYLDSTNVAISQERSSLDLEQGRVDREYESLNSDITYWNSRGGATGATYDSLMARRKTYSADSQTLKRNSTTLNQEVSTYNARLGEYKKTLALAEEQFKLAGGSTTENAVGIYDPSDRSITVYSYSDPQHLRLILMHELGHALGCGHTNVQGSIMYPELTSATSLANPVPTAQDLELVGGN